MIELTVDWENFAVKINLRFKFSHEKYFVAGRFRNVVGQVAGIRILILLVFNFCRSGAPTQIF